MVTWVLRCKLYPGATPWRNAWSARPFRGGGLIPCASMGLDRWLSRQNPAYRPVSQKSTTGNSGAFYNIPNISNSHRRNIPIRLPAAPTSSSDKRLKATTRYRNQNHRREHSFSISLTNQTTFLIGQAKQPCTESICRHTWEAGRSQGKWHASAL